MRESRETLSGDVKWIGRADCRHCMMRKGTLFGALTNKEVDELPSPIDQFEFPPASRIYSAGEANDDVYTICEGFVKAVAHAADGSDRIVRLYKRGDVVGLESLINDSYQHTVISLSTVSVCRIPAKVIKRLLGKSSKLSEQLMRQWQSGIERADYWLTHLTTGMVETRIAWLLKLLVELGGPEQQTVIRLPSNQDIASIVDTTVESVSRALAKIKRQRVLMRVAPHTYQCDLSKLTA